MLVLAGLDRACAPLSALGVTGSSKCRRSVIHFTEAGEPCAFKPATQPRQVGSAMHSLYAFL